MNYSAKLPKRTVLGRARCTKDTGLELREKINRYNAYDIALCAAALCRHA